MLTSMLTLMLQGGTITIAHHSGGPLSDIVKPSTGNVGVVMCHMRVTCRSVMCACVHV